MVLLIHLYLSVLQSALWTMLITLLDKLFILLVLAEWLKDNLGYL